MTDIFSLVDTALGTLAPVPYAWDEYLTESGAALPDTYLVVSDVTDQPAMHADNQEVLRFYRIQVSGYSRNGMAALPNTDAAMIGAGFAKSNRVKLPYNNGSGHFGLATDYTILLDTN